MKLLLSAARLLALLSLITGFAYPLVATALAQLLFPAPAGGSLVRQHGVIVGSALLAQKFTSPGYFWPRPSAADYAPLPSGASNKGSTSEDLRQAIESRRTIQGAAAPAELLTASGSGLDPHLSPAGAQWQVARVAAARGLPVETIARLVQDHTQPPQFGLLGEPTVNVLALNLALDELK